MVVYAQTTMYTFMSYNQNAGKHHNKKTGNKMFKMFGLFDNDDNKYESHSQINYKQIKLGNACLLPFSSKYFAFQL